MSLIKELQQLAEDQEDRRSLYEMAGVLPEESGVQGYHIWISPKGKAVHGPRIKVSKGVSYDDDTNTSISISDTPEYKSGELIPSSSLAQISKWIVLNKDLLLKFWNGEIHSHRDVLNNLKSI